MIRIGVKNFLTSSPFISPKFFLKNYSRKMPYFSFISNDPARFYSTSFSSPSSKAAHRFFSSSKERVIDPTKLVSERIALPKEYREVMRRVPFREVGRLEKTIFALLKEDHSKFLDLVKEGSLAEILKIENYLAHSLAALHEGQISPSTFATLVLPSASLDPNKECISLFMEDGGVNPEARDLIEQTLDVEGFRLYGISFLTPAQLDEFFELMKKESPLERQFFLEKEDRSFSGVRRVIRKAYGVNALSKCVKDGLSRRMIPSASMMQNFLKVQFGKNAMEMNFVLGFSKTEDIEKNERKGKRDVALCFPGVSLPLHLHGEIAQGIDMTYHDFFHSIICSSAPVEVRDLFLDIAKVAREKGMTEFYEFFVDLEVNEYFRSYMKGGVTDLDYLLIRQIYGNLLFITSNLLPDFENNNAFIEKIKNLVLRVSPEISLELLNRLDKFFI